MLITHHRLQSALSQPVESTSGTMCTSGLVRTVCVVDGLMMTSCYWTLC